MSEETAGKTADQSVDLQHMPELVIVTGMSGAGRTEAMHSFEDLGYFCVDNLPSSLIGNLLELTGMPGQPDEKRRLAVVCDARTRDLFASLAGELKKLKGLGIDYRILFLDAADEKLLLRSTILAASNKIYLDCCFDAMRQEESLWPDILPDLA